MLKCNNFPSKWLDVSDVIIEKVKGKMMNKLRIAQSIEVDP